MTDNQVLVLIALFTLLGIVLGVLLAFGICDYGH